MLERQLEDANNIKIENIGRGDSDGITYVATETGPCFHHVDCKWVAGKKDLIEFSSHDEAAQDRVPCKTCRS